jgi:histidine triad (HIT) family protein
VATVFTRIIDGELPGTFVWRDDECVAILSINPLHAGHTLVIPRAEVDHWIDLDPARSAHLFDVARTIGRAQQAALGAQRVGLMVVGVEVPHTHLHVVPFDTAAELNFALADPDPPAGSIDRAAAAIRAALRALGAEHVSD